MTLVQTLAFGTTGNAAAAAVYGWSPPEPGYTWAIGPRSALVLEVPAAPFGYILQIAWSPFLAGSQEFQPVGISIGGRKIADHQVRQSETATFPCPPPLPHEQRLLITFDHPEAAQPNLVSGHHDDRPLALCFRHLQLIRLDEPPPPPPPPCTIAAEGDTDVAQRLATWPAPPGAIPPAPDAPGGFDVVFGSGGHSAPLLAAGWSAPEPGYVWTSGTTSRLTLPRPARADAYRLHLQLHPFVRPTTLPAQRLTVQVNGAQYAAPPITQHAILTLDLPSALLAAAPSLDITLTLPDAARPCDIIGGDDDRLLALQLKRLLLTPIDIAPPAPPTPAEPIESPLPIDELMLRFESIGENCEFGLVQRRCGVEPLGLLRFASAPYDKLMAALRARFAAMGAPENIQVELSSNGREYMVLDRAYGFYYHAWVLAGEMSPAEILAREARRVPFLVRKLTEDIAAGEKLLVYHGMSPLTQQAASTLAATLRAYGPTTLLWVEVADDTNPPGTVLWVEGGLMKAYIARFAPGEDAHDLALESWIELCRRAVGLRDALTQ
jgi:hypothetical protein